MASKRQQTMAKMARERTVREKRARKLEKKHAAAEERKARAAGLPWGPAATETLGEEGEIALDSGPDGSVAAEAPAGDAPAPDQLG